MVKKLAGIRLVEREPYRGVTLSAAGERIALEVIRHHRLVESFLAEVLDVPWDEAHAEADRWEHVLSEEVEDRNRGAVRRSLTVSVGGRNHAVGREVAAELLVGEVSG